MANFGDYLGDFILNREIRSKTASRKLSGNWLTALGSAGPPRGPTHWCSETPFLVFWEHNFCLKCSLNQCQTRSDGRTVCTIQEAMMGLCRVSYPSDKLLLVSSLYPSRREKGESQRRENLYLSLSFPFPQFPVWSMLPPPSRTHSPSRDILWPWLHRRLGRNL